MVLPSFYDRNKKPLECVSLLTLLTLLEILKGRQSLAGLK